MKRFICFFSFLLIIQHSQAQSAADLSYPEIDSLLDLYDNTSKFDKGISLSLEASQKSGKEDSLCAEYLEWSTFFYEEKGDKEEAIQYYKKALQIFAKTSGINSPRYARTLIFFALFYQQRMGNFDKALLILIQAKNIREKIFGKLHPDFALSLNYIARLHQSMGNFDKALHLYTQEKNIIEKNFGKLHPSFANSLIAIASLQSDRKNYNKALNLYTQAKNIVETTLGKKHFNFATILNNIAITHKNMGNFDKALPFYIQANNILGKYSEKNYQFAVSLSNIALLHKEKANYHKALPIYIQANNIFKTTLGKKHPYFAKSLNSIANLHRSMGNVDKAWINIIQAIESSSNLHLSSTISPLWADTLLNASFASNLHLKNTISSLHTIFYLLQEDSTIHNVSNKQIIIADLVNTLITKLRNNITNDKDKLKLLAQSSQWLQRSLKCLSAPKHNNKAFALVDQNKSVLLGQASKSEQAYRLGNLPDSLVSTDKKLLKNQSQLQAKLLENRPKQEKDSLRNELNDLNQDIDDFLQVIKSDYPKYHKLKYLQLGVKVADVQKLLDNKTALLEYVISNSIVHIFYIDKEQVVWKKVVVDNKKLSQRIKSLHQVLSNYKMLDKNKQLSYENYTEQAHWFYQKLIAPILANKKNIKNLILVTDGELGHLPFETFLVEQAARGVSNYNQLHYLVTDYNISYNYSAGLWKENMEAPTPKNNGQILGVAANYDIPLDSSMMEIRLPTDQWLRELLEPLPNARKEVEALQEKYQGFFAFDLLASEKTVKQKAGNFAILHFATHGISDKKRPILSSLAFTEDNDSIESNFWQAHEISKMQLNANLVVLSACETGFGKFEKGNGIASLARSFMYAGAPSLIVSLWQVNDYATSEIMKFFYDNLANGMKIDQALRQAKLQYMKTAVGIMAHPAFWSPFIQIGKTQPVSIKTKGGGAMPWIIGVTILVFVGGFAMRRKRNKEAA